MERHKSLYKANSSMMSPKTNRVNERTAIRAKKRIERFASRRTILISPVTVVSAAKEAIATEGNKENTLKAVSEQTSDVKQLAIEPEVTKNTAKIATVACNRKVEVMNRQEKFLQRFIEWRQSKKQQEEMKKHTKRKPPFLLAGKNVGPTVGKNSKPPQQTSATSSFAPKNHRFKPPEGLKNPVLPETKATSNPKPRQSIYTVAPAAHTKKPEPEDGLKSSNIPPKALPNNRLMRTTTTAKTAVSKATSASKPRTQETALLNGVKTTKATVQLPPVRKAMSVKTQKISATSGVGVFTKPTLVKSEAQASRKPPPLKPPPETLRSVPTTVKPNIQTGTRIVKAINGDATAVVKKSGEVGEAKEATSTKRTDPISKSKPKLSVCMKAKKVNSTVSTRKAIANKKNTAKLNLKKEQLLEGLRQQIAIIVETPRNDFSKMNPFGTLVTSTQRKSQSNSQSTLEFLALQTSIVDSISPVEPVNAIPNRASAIKRQPLKTLSNNRTKSPDKGKKNKFNFVIYHRDTPSKLFDEEVQTDGKEQTPLKPLKVESSLRVKSLNNRNSANDQGPLNYLSPYLGVSRGTISSKNVEKEERNNIYLKTDVVDSPASQTLRCTLKTACYFRQQLSDEIKRLREICDKWEEYKSENLLHLRATGGAEMINATIGQTKLLTSKKFLQFSMLIDRFEKGATSQHWLMNDGSEDTNPITAVHLENFWSTIELQIDNVNKSFLNLDRWHENNWLDPDHLQQEQQAPRLRKTKKCGSVKSSISRKTDPSSDLQQLILKMHADMRKKKALEEAAAKKTDGGVGAPDVIPPPMRKRRSRSQPGGSKQRRRSIHLRTPSSSFQNTSPAMTAAKVHKSILKTPGTAKGVKLKNVISSAKLRMKKYKFTIDSDQSNGDEQADVSIDDKVDERADNERNQRKGEEDDDDDDGDKRTYTLRTRKVVLRPSSEFKIPK